MNSDHDVYFCRLACVHLHGGRVGAETASRPMQGKGSSLLLLSFSALDLITFAKQLFHRQQQHNIFVERYLNKQDPLSFEKTRCIFAAKQNAKFVGNNDDLGRTSFHSSVFIKIEDGGLTGLMSYPAPD